MSTVQTMHVSTNRMLHAEIAGLRIALFMCAASCQGGNSAAGATAAKELGISFPVTMQKLANRARKEGLDPRKLWPWWDKAPALAPHKCVGAA